MRVKPGKERGNPQRNVRLFGDGEKKRVRNGACKSWINSGNRKNRGRGGEYSFPPKYTIHISYTEIAPWGS